MTDRQREFNEKVVDLTQTVLGLIENMLEQVASLAQRVDKLEKPEGEP
jgi:hypothetical protein